MFSKFIVVFFLHERSHRACTAAHIRRQTVQEVNYTAETARISVYYAFQGHSTSLIFSERHVDVRYMSSPVGLSVVCNTRHPTVQPVEIFGNVSMPAGTLAIL